MRHLLATISLVSLGFLVTSTAATAQSPDLEDFYGFDGLEVVRIDPGAGPIASSDLDGDGLQDLIIVNNFRLGVGHHVF